MLFHQRISVIILLDSFLFLHFFLSILFHSIVIFAELLVLRMCCELSFPLGQTIFQNAFIIHVRVARYVFINEIIPTTTTTRTTESNVIGPIISAGISRTNVSRRAARFRIH